MANLVLVGRMPSGPGHAGQREARELAIRDARSVGWSWESITEGLGLRPSGAKWLRQWARARGVE